jgi:hypothetical protein
MRQLKPSNPQGDLKLFYESFNQAGNFILILNYPGAPARYAVVSKNGVRLSKIKQKNDFYKDTIGFFPLFKKQAVDALNASIRTKEIDQKKQSRF